MRLARPRLAAPVGATLDPLDAVSKKIEDMVADTESAKYPIGEMLLAPQQFEFVKHTYVIDFPKHQRIRPLFSAGVHKNRYDGALEEGKGD